MSEIAAAVKSVFDALGTIFRHLLPGIFIVGASAAAYPSWFNKVDISKNEWLIVIAGIAIVAGNVWLVFHRYCIQQIVDLVFYVLKVTGGPCKNNKWNYSASVAEHVEKFFNNISSKEALHRHIRFRTSSVVLMYIASEILIIFALTSDAGSFFDKHRREALVLGAIGFLSAIWQNFITRKIEGKVINTT